MVIIFSFLLLGGILLGQWADLSGLKEIFSICGSVCLSYIMIEVGMEFSGDKKGISSYGWDFITASIAAIFPAVLWISYFLVVIHSDWKPAVLSGLSSAPTSAGVLFAMMTAAGLGATWVFKKARVLAVLDDLVTILLLMPLQIVMYGFEWASMISCLMTVVLIAVSFIYKNKAPLPTGRLWRIVYSLLLTGLAFAVQKTLHVHWGVLIPAFVLGAVIRPPLDQADYDEDIQSVDVIIKGLFMLFVGLSFPKIITGNISWGQTALHVLALTVLANTGKLFLVFCYRKEASFKERLALGVAMFPRGEVGAAVLLIGISYGLGGYENALAVLGLAFNLVLTGTFIWIVISLLKENGKKRG